MYLWDEVLPIQVTLFPMDSQVITVTMGIDLDRIGPRSEGILGPMGSVP